MEAYVDVRWYVVCGGDRNVQVRSTWPTTNIPGEDCLPYDGSEVPDCSEYIDPDHYLPYYHEHSQSKNPSPRTIPHPFHHSDCSRFWECGPYKTCLFECASCPLLDFPGGADGECNYMCEGPQGFQWALTFDDR